MRILYVDDDRINVMLFEHVCAAIGGIEVESAGSGAEALEQLAPWQPDLLVIDLHLPDTDGFALLPILRGAPGAARERPLPAVLYTAEPVDLVQVRARAAGFEHCWTKPARMEDLMRLRDQLLPR